MSDLYLVLRRRLGDVVDWVELGTDVLRDARKRQGLSYEAMGRRLNVASKTWERYEKSGRVPRQLLPAVAELLDLEIEQPARLRVMEGERRDPPETVERRLERLEALVSELLDGQILIADALGVEQLEQAERQADDEQPEAPSASPRARRQPAGRSR